MGEFEAIDWQAPLDIDNVVASVPENATVKGLFFRTAIGQAREATGQSPGRGSYDLFGDYPSAELARVLADCAHVLYPNDSARLGLRWLGHKVFAHIKSTTAGTFLFSVAGNNVHSAFKLVGRAYKLFSNSVRADCTQESDHILRVELRNIWSFADCYHVGIFEGAVASFDREADISIRRVSPCDLDMRVALRERPEAGVK